MAKGSGDEVVMYSENPSIRNITNCRPTFWFKSKILDITFCSLHVNFAQRSKPSTLITRCSFKQNSIPFIARYEATFEG